VAAAFSYDRFNQKSLKLRKKCPATVCLNLEQVPGIIDFFGAPADKNRQEQAQNGEGN